MTLQQSFTIIFSFEHENPNIDAALKWIRGIIFIEEPEIELYYRREATKEEDIQGTTIMLTCKGGSIRRR
jgi:hypothetical protein